MKVDSIFNIASLEKYIVDGYITKRKHPQYDLWIYNYSASVQYSQKWDAVTLNCRGLILDADYNIVARPFKKFFNLEEERHVATPDFEVYEKLDGSLGILFFYNNEWIIATRGSFESEQAVKATQMLKQYNLKSLDKNYTYLVEIIYAQNVIVCRYDYEELILLAVIEIGTGEELNIYNLPFQVDFGLAKVYNGITDFKEIQNLNKDNEEGFVVKFSNNDRMKIKFQEYVRLHRILTGVSNVSIWEFLSEGKNFDELLDRVPDEFYSWCKQTVKELEYKFNEILEECKLVYKELEDRRTTALYFKEQKYPHLLFLMLDGKSLDKAIWKLVRPTWQKPFSNKEAEE